MFLYVISKVSTFQIPKTNILSKSFYSLITIIFSVKIQMNQI